MYVVTGASGFLGRAVVVALLERGLPVMRVTRSRLSPLPGATDVQIARYDGFVPPPEAVLIHLAETRDIAAANRQGKAHVGEVTEALAGLLRNRASHVVYASSAVVYGDREAHPRAPQETVLPQSPYAEGKLACERLATGAGGVAVRLSNLYGPGMADDNVLSDVLNQIPGRGDLRVRDVGPVRDFLWATDAAAGVAAAAMQKAKGVLNLGTGVGTSVRDLARKALALAGESGRGVVATAPAAPSSHLVLDIEKTVVALGWRPAIDLDRGLSALLKVRA